MFEKIKDISKILILPASLLYFFGFLSISSYYARFGIVSFDIINSRFIIAGFFLLFAFLVASCISWWSFYKIFSKDNFFKYVGFKELIRRPLTYFVLIGSTLVASNILGSIFTLGKYSKPLGEDKLIYGLNLGKYDFIFELINRINFSSPSYNFIIKAFLHLSSFVLIIVLLTTFLVIISKWALEIFRYFKKPTEIKKSDNTLETKELVEEKAEMKDKTNRYSGYLNIISVIFELLSLIFVGSVFVYCLMKLSSNIFDFNSFSGFHFVNSGLIFAWLFVTETFICLSLVMLKFPKRNDGIDSFRKQFSDIDNVQNAFYIFVIPILSSLFLFGSTIFPRIPYAIGGGQPREIEIILNDTVNIDLQSKKLYQIGENDQFIFVISNDNDGVAQAIQISKDNIKLIKTRTSTSTDTTNLPI